jgi:hypothetical protein
MAFDIEFTQSAADHVRSHQSHVDDFDLEVELLKNNSEFMQFLQQRSQENAAISLGDLRKELEL